MNNHIDQEFKIKVNREIAKDVYEMILKGDTSLIKNPGEFINIKIDSAETYLRRPISICDYNSREIAIIYKVFGVGTKLMSEMEKGDTLKCLIGLGNGFTIDAESKKVLLVGGGVGVPPLYNLAKKLREAGKELQIVLGFASKNDVFYEAEFLKLGEVKVTTLDGSYGHKGYVTDIAKNLFFDYYYACGPNAMLKSLIDFNCEGQLSFEERFGCGFGACMGCSCKTKDGYKRICKEGPVLKSSEVVF